MRKFTTDSEMFETLSALAHNVSFANHALGIAVARETETGRLHIEDVRYLLKTAAAATTKPSTATAFRYVAKWKEELRQSRNNGRGA